ncbi:MAG: hypothetical protein WCY75_03535 [Sulfurimonadaceae bacterium]|jgi:hypothetical protein|nr:hypothetical protein [Arcobacteraceae bacterium]
MSYGSMILLRYTLVKNSKEDNTKTQNLKEFLKTIWEKIWIFKH